jgi:hypothetical protein
MSGKKVKKGFEFLMDTNWIFQEPIDWLKIEALLNIYDIFVTLEVFQDPID